MCALVDLPKQGRLLVLLAWLAWAVGLHRSMAMADVAGWVEDEAAPAVQPIPTASAEQPAAKAETPGA